MTQKVRPYAASKNKRGLWDGKSAHQHQELTLEELPKLRRVNYLNNIVKNDHKSVKRKSRYRPWYQYFDTASATISGIETMRMIQKGQVKYLAKKDIISQKN